MSRDYDAVIETAQQGEGSRSQCSAEIFKTRIWFSTWSGTDTAYDNVDRIVQDAVWTGTQLISVVVNPTTLVLEKYVNGVFAGNFTSGATVTEYTYKWAKPAICYSGGNIYVFFIDSPNMIIQRGYCLPGATNLTVENVTAAEVEPGSLSVVSPTDATQVVYLGIDNGGTRPTVYYKSGTWQTHTMPYRFMSRHNNVYTATVPADTAPENVIYFTAVELSSKIYVYYSRLDGDLLGCIYDKTHDYWSDVFVAIPRDMSTYQVQDSFISNSTIFLVGSYARADGTAAVTTTDEYTTRAPWTMINSSTDGRYFAMNRWSSVSKLGAHVCCALDTSNYLVYFASGDRYKSEAYSYWLDPAHCSSLEIPIGSILSLTGAVSNGNDVWQMTLSDPHEAFYGNSLLAVGNVCTVDFGPVLDVGYYPIQAGEFIITDLSYDFGDGIRTPNLTLTNSSLAILNSSSYPNYVELTAKQCLRDDLNLVDNFLNAQPGEPVEIDIDFSNSNYAEGGGMYYIATTATHSVCVKIEDLKAELSLKDYPLVIDTNPLGWEMHPQHCIVNVYAWSRTLTGTNLNVDDLGVYFKTIRGSTEYETVVMATDLMGTTYCRPPKYYLGTTVTGYYPLDFQIGAGSLPIGDKIKSIGVVFHDHTTTWCRPDRLTMWYNGVGVRPLATTMWIPETVNSTTWDFCYPSNMRGPSILFSQRPYNAVNFQAIARFEVSSTVTESYYIYGIVGLAEDSENYVLGAYEHTPSSGLIQSFIRVVQHGNLVYETSPKVTVTNFSKIKFEHRDGYFATYELNSTTSTWSAASSSFLWDAGLGSMLSSSVAVPKIGIYGEVTAKHFPIVGFSADNSSLLAWKETPADEAQGVGFSIAGQVLLNGCVLSYEGATGYTTYDLKGTTMCSYVDPEGPWQIRNVTSWNPYRSDNHFYGYKQAAEVSLFRWQNNATHYNDYSGYVMAFDDGYAHKVHEVDWKPFITNAGAVEYTLNRSRWFLEGDDVSDSHDMSVNTWVTGALTTVRASTGQSSTFFPPGTVAYIFEGTASLRLKSFYASSLDTEDMGLTNYIDALSKGLGAKAEFPGDITVTDTNVTTVWSDL